ncbi:hypothetical protein DFJ58DRAFT_371957 [Suillus subalutaceus]|uniref:uncharacterized protein n=1 Tax=Suillus subalutaceus TaxID=48586 RepID=UPI001B8847A3|nr:uncharacterized protein DFJ58DRAFT_371957 [Suillus subalutaceus]KAG1854949.1 hypothetical protein DFJ58DRAFT_371957 [Suillus subalutaceus]
MDKVNGISASDRGDVCALNALMKMTKIPIICIANDRGAQKLKPLIANTFGMSFRQYVELNFRSNTTSLEQQARSSSCPMTHNDDRVQGENEDPCQRHRSAYHCLSVRYLTSFEYVIDVATIQ